MKKLSGISSYSGALFYTGLLLGLSIIIVAFLCFGMVGGIVVACIPITSLMAIYIFNKPYWMLMLIFVVNYFIMGLGRYIEELQGGIVIDILLFSTLLILVLQKILFETNWKPANNMLTYISLAWLLYCTFELLNPETTLTLWATSVRGITVYVFVFTILTALLFNKYRDLKRILLLWAVLTILAVMKAYIQRNMGFDSAEKYWLFVSDGARTHVIRSGIRYFSFFTDAANFGASMGMSMVVFSISALYIKNKYLKILFSLVALGASYGLIISGTRAALAIPFVGYAVFILITKGAKLRIVGFTFILAAFVFFNFTYIGQSNSDIRRMRSAFRGTEDASFNVRIENQKHMKEFMAHYPFGIGVGKTKQTHEGDYMYGMATDSSLVFIWLETGIVGLIFYLLIFISVILRGIYDVVFRIKNKELKGIMCALISGLAGILVASYGNEILQQFPNGPIVYMCMAFIVLGRYFDKELAEAEAENVETVVTLKKS